MGWRAAVAAFEFAKAYLTKAEPKLGENRKVAEAAGSLQQATKDHKCKTRLAWGGA
jgi:hypothetical protein